MIDKNTGGNSRGRLRILWLAALSGLMSLTLLAAPTQSLGLLEEANRHLEAGRTEEGIALLRKALRLTPDDAFTHLSLGIALSRLGRWDEAVESLERAKALNPRLAEIRYRLGQAYLESGRIERAEAELSAASELDPDHTEAQRDRTQAMARRDEREGDDSDQGASIRRSEGAKIQFNLGLALESRKLPAQAEAAFRRALELDPNLTVARSGLGTLLGRQGRLEEAAEHLAAAIEAQPDNADAHAELGDVYRKQGRTSDAIAAYRRSVAIEAQAEVHSSLGVLLQETARWSEAQESLDEAIRLNPASADLRLARGNLFYALRQGRRAVADYKKAVELKPRSAEAHYGLALAYLLIPDKASARKQYRILRTLSPAYARTLRPYIR